MNIQKSEIKVDVNGKPVNAYLASPSDGGPGVLVLHAWWGLKQSFKEMCDQLAEHGFTALAPDYYQGMVANTIEEAKALMEKRDDELAEETVKSAKDHLISLCEGQPVGVMGFSMGAAWALSMAAADPDISAVVMCYGVGEADLGQIKAKILGHFAESDEWEPLKYVKQMEEDMQKAGLDVTLHTYPGAAHWFMESDRPEYDPESAKLAWDRTFEFLDTSLRAHRAERRTPSGDEA
ncbi:MAG TPA: dienelactone hydrolase family protein [Anaerolineales bacterium]|nr:dienelactone hydrolase family protein [Anaerolineales bacterium]